MGHSTININGKIVNSPINSGDNSSQSVVYNEGNNANIQLGNNNYMSSSNSFNGKKSTKRSIDMSNININDGEVNIDGNEVNIDGIRIDVERYKKLDAMDKSGLFSKQAEDSKESEKAAEETSNQYASVIKIMTLTNVFAQEQAACTNIIAALVSVGMATKDETCVEAMKKLTILLAELQPTIDRVSEKTTKLSKEDKRNQRKIKVITDEATDYLTALLAAKAEAVTALILLG